MNIHKYKITSFAWNHNTDAKRTLETQVKSQDPKFHVQIVQFIVHGLMKKYLNNHKSLYKNILIFPEAI